MLACVAAKPGGRIAIFDKFLPRGTRPGWAMRIFDAISSFLATDLTRSLEPMLEAAGLKAEVDKSMGPGGYYRVVRAVPQ